MKPTILGPLTAEQAIKDISKALKADSKALRNYGIQTPEAMVELMGPWFYSRAFAHIGKDKYGYYL